MKPADIHGGFSRYKVGDFLEQHRDRGKEKDRLLFKNVHHKQAALDGKVIVITEDERYLQLILGSYCDVRPAKEMEMFHEMLYEILNPTAL